MEFRVLALKLHNLLFEVLNQLLQLLLALFQVFLELLLHFVGSALIIELLIHWLWIVAIVLVLNNHVEFIILEGQVVPYLVVLILHLGEAESEFLWKVKSDVVRAHLSLDLAFSVLSRILTPVELWEHIRSEGWFLVI